jgi:hypothetical protein
MLSDTLSDVVDTLAEAEEDYTEHYSPKIMARVKFHTDCLHQLRRELDNPNEPEDNSVLEDQREQEFLFTVTVWSAFLMGVWLVSVFWIKVL